MNESKTAVVLLVEDDPADQKLVQNALSNQDTSCEIHIAETGEEALEYLRQSGSDDAKKPLPSVILLDLNMPGMGGKEFLRQLKTDESLRYIPVVVLTTSDSQVDVEQCYKLQASSYIQKSASPEEFESILKKFARYWFVTSMLANN